MAGWFSRGMMKPPLGARINYAHPLANQVRFLALFNEPVRESGTYSNLALPAIGTVSAVASDPLTYTPGGAGQATITATSNRQGAAVSLPIDGIYTIGANQGWLPTTAGTVAVVRRKQDTTLRAAVVLSVVDDTFSLYAPWSNGTYFFRAGVIDATTGVVPYSIDVPDVIVATFGLAGSTVWINGVKQASQATPVTRTNSGSAGHQLILNGGARGGDLIDLNVVQVSATQWSDDLCRWWSAEPYAHLYTETQRTYAFLSHGSDVIVSEAIGSAVGTCTVSGVSAYRIGGAGKKSGFGNQKPSRRRHR